MTACFCRDVLRFVRSRWVLDIHCLRHGLSWSQVEGIEDWM